MPDNISRELVCHPLTAAGGTDAIEVAVAAEAGDKLALSFVLHGDLDNLQLPVGKPCRRMDELWRHTCFEAFLMPGDGPGYREYNFSPSGEWASYMFRDYRQVHDQRISQTEDEPAPVIRVHRGARSLTLEAELPLPVLTDRSLRLGLSAVTEAADGKLCYWALRHPPGKPDFHHLDAFDLQLDLR